MQIIFNKIYNLKYLYCSSSLVMIVQLYLILINRLIHQSGLKMISTWFQAYSGSYVGVSFNFLTPTDSRHSVVCHDYLRWHCREQFQGPIPKFNSKIQFQNPILKSNFKGLGIRMTLFCLPLIHPHKLFSATRHAIELKFSQKTHLTKTK